MYNSVKIIIGLIIFVGLMAYPIWSSVGRPGPAPELVLTEKAKEAKVCVEPTPWMKESHMQLLNDWRNKVVREHDRLYTNAEGRSYTISLTNTCLDCHSNKDKFCDRCHNYASVRPYCWDCHNVPKGNNDG